MSANFVSGKISLPGLQMASFLLCPQMRGRGERSQESSFSDISSYKNMNPIDQNSTLLTSFNLNYFLTPDNSRGFNIQIWGVGTQFNL